MKKENCMFIANVLTGHIGPLPWSRMPVNNYLSKNILLPQGRPLDLNTT